MPGVTSPSADSTSITVRFERPDPPNGIIVAYHIQFFIVGQEPETSQMVNVTQDLNSTVLHRVLTGLEPDSNYSVRVSEEANAGLSCTPNLSCTVVRPDSNI